MKPRAYIFIGPSGCGKGTQVKNLIVHIEKTQENKDVLYIETGSRFRDFIKGEKHTNKLSKKLYLDGKRQPDFLASYMWSQTLIDEFKGEKHLILDGTPRSLNEAKVLDSALNFFNFNTVTIIFLNVGRAWSRKRLSERKREDDSLEGIEKRLDWYQEDVVPAVEYYQKHKTYTFLEINGEQTIEAVWEDIKKSL